ncbi:MAG TPA: MarR family transcriptional regulator [Gemmatimonadaceae bacterium]|nr:MarR family transcriptional regulator [Gemmatimonadaceae bacterium]
MPTQPPPREDHLGQLLLRAWRLVVADGLEQVHAAGFDDVTAGHLPLFANLAADEKNGVRLVDLAGRAQVSRQWMARVAKDLESLGYVRLEQDADDQRAIRVRLDARGRAFRAAADKGMARLVAKYASDIGATRVAALHETLARLINSLSERAPAAVADDSFTVPARPVRKAQRRE